MQWNFKFLIRKLRKGSCQNQLVAGLRPDGSSLTSANADPPWPAPTLGVPKDALQHGLGEHCSLNNSGLEEKSPRTSSCPRLLSQQSQNTCLLCISYLWHFILFKSPFFLRPCLAHLTHWSLSKTLVIYFQPLPLPSQLWALSQLFSRGVGTANMGRGRDMQIRCLNSSFQAAKNVHESLMYSLE